MASQTRRSEGVGVLQDIELRIKQAFLCDVVGSNLRDVIYEWPLFCFFSKSVSPRSESNDVTMTGIILHPDDDNSNSMMSGTSEPPRQMVLKMEKNLGARSRLEDMDDDTQVS